MVKSIKGFAGQYSFLSNFTMCNVTLDGKDYPSTEHAYVAAKTFDLEHRDKITKLKTASEAKKYGRALVLRHDWEEVKLEIMRDLLMQKFSQQPFRSMLLATGKAYIEETNWWFDTYWGVCNGVGQNNLGKLLMEIRDILDGIRVNNLPDMGD